MVTEKSAGKSISIEETRKLLGAEEPIDIGTVSFNPLTLGALGARIQERLISTGGRPTDPRWEITRKVPMSRSVWRELQRIAESLEGEGARVAAGHIAAVALERGLLELNKQNRSGPEKKRIKSPRSA